MGLIWTASECKYNNCDLINDANRISDFLHFLPIALEFLYTSQLWLTLASYAYCFFTGIILSSLSVPYVRFNPTTG